MRTPIVLLAAALGLHAQATRLTVAIVHDPSRSQTGFAGAIAADEQRMVTSLPDGARLVVFTSGLRVRRIFEGDLNTARRGEALRQLQAVRPVEPNTDLAAALDEALRALAAFDGARTLVFFTDAKNRPGPDSPFRGRSFDAVLNAATLPPSTRIVVRVYGTEPLNITRQGVVVVRDNPDWPALLGLEVAPPPAPEPPPSWYKWRFWIGSAILGVLAFSALMWRRLAGADSRLLGPLAPVPEPPAPAQPRSVTRFRVQSARATLDLEEGARDSAIIGDNPIADLPLDAADGAWIQLRIPNAKRHAGPTLHNAGAAPIFVGARRIPSRSSVELPPQYVEARLGREILQIYPETLVLTEGENS